MDLTNQQVKQILKSVATLHERQGVSYEAAPIKRLLEDLGASVRNVPAIEFRGDLFADFSGRRCPNHARRDFRRDFTATHGDNWQFEE